MHNQPISRNESPEEYVCKDVDFYYELKTYYTLEKVQPIRMLRHWVLLIFKIGNVHIKMASLMSKRETVVPRIPELYIENAQQLSVPTTPVGTGSFGKELKIREHLSTDPSYALDQTNTTDRTSYH